MLNMYTIRKFTNNLFSNFWNGPVHTGPVYTGPVYTGSKIYSKVQSFYVHNSGQKKSTIPCTIRLVEMIVR